MHAQATVLMYQHPRFYSPYSGTNSLQSVEGRTTTATGTIFAGMKLWHGAEVYLNPEMAGGQGPSNVLGVAGAINGEAPRVASPAPQPYIARCFLRQTLNIGGDHQQVPDAPNQLPGVRLSDRLQLTIGKFSANDIFDTNIYSHDPRAQFSNWALWENGAWDYPADTRGYTQGAVLELFWHAWVYRLGLLEEPKMVNGQALEGHLTKARALTGEIERDYRLAGHPGALRLLGYANRSRSGSYRRALDLARAQGGVPDIGQTRAYRSKFGIGLDWEQEVTTELGIFSRVGWNDGASESWAFTEIDRCVSLGASLTGTRWHRQDDILAVAVAVNGLSKPHRDYLSAGGYGFIIGDGALNYRYEEILEAYYAWKASAALTVSPSLQYVLNPGYNHDRGPVWFFGLRFHLDV